MTNNERYPGNDIDDTAKIHQRVRIGKDNTIGPFCIIGWPPEWKGHEDQYGRVTIGHNNIITGLVTIDSGAESDTVIGSRCYLMKGAHVGHDAHISSDVTISCGARIGGHTIVNLYCNIGLNAVIHQKQEIAEGCMIGMGSVVTKKLVTAPYKTYAGNPAKLIGNNDKHPNYTIYLKDSI
jgi:UDP-N-acetylglucosamine acyltransferase